MRSRRVIGILERRLIGVAMSAILFFLERRLSERATGAAGTGPPARERRPP
jgi:hypothetical protein